MMGEMMAQAAAAAPAPDYTGLKKSTIDIPVRDGSKIPARLYQPEGKSPGALVVLYHGGGFCIGVPEMEEDIALEAVRTWGATAVSVDYRMAPEHPFPVAIHDSFDALKWLASNASSLSADPSKGFIVGGVSAGAIISAVISHQAKDTPLAAPLTGVWLNAMLCCGQSALPPKYKDLHKSSAQNAEAPVLPQKAIDFFMVNYKPDDSSPEHSSLLWPSGHEGLPPTFIQVHGMDPLRDDGLIYDLAMKEAGVKVETIVYPGVPHGFEGMFPTIGPAKKSFADRTKWFGERLG